MIFQNIKNVLKRINVTRRNNVGRYLGTSRLNFKIVKCKLFDIGEGISEVEITQWNKNEGDQVSEMESLLTVQSDKAAVDITSKYSGVLVKKYANEKDLIKVGSYFCEIDTEDDVIETNEDEKREKVEEGNQTDEDKDDEKIELKDELDIESSSELNAGEWIQGKSNSFGSYEEGKQKMSVKASPGVKKKAMEYNLDINTIGAYFNKDTVNMKDIEIYHKKKNQSDFENLRNSSSSSSCSNSRDNRSIIEEVPLKGIKLAMCKSMNDALSIPLFHLNEMYNVENIVKSRKEIKKSVHEKENINITLTSILIKLISNTLKEFPILNSKFNSKKNSYTIYKNHNICIAMDTPNGLLVPNIKNVEEKNIINIQKDLILLRDKANQMRLSKSDITDGTITISNFGAISGTFATPIIFDNQACIIGISKIQKNIFLKDESKELNSLSDLVASDTMNLTYGADHRFIDGATLAQFSKKLKKVVESTVTIDPYEH
ncbi:lipoamide acyltransferase component of branched-chain alpha-keto acid dehydrogenase complex, putative [Plasmodium malariae]|uniref:Dihydrolipoamide acetyltransferase component of pyruvate dehydrogenase complex n=1 Tax=Plasmodium malariae TaxID=5858 RepID=A0A1C3KYY3_PLAMA|nr:lipoamide acyltransferase component of branched-chain alpha-keto acid dehydrogenase complex, putative [Plasmodium malariae]